MTSSFYLEEKELQPSYQNRLTGEKEGVPELGELAQVCQNVKTVGLSKHPEEKESSLEKKGGGNLR